ncbi:ras guanine nucleotide exchange factor P-like [Gigantopelta aegis]|uniref:ras guanine nucleotide exchange factor P-like n=1 Tax=Gigantopelta aegis TaxID=1735272 RepID=UPI001B88B84F|nr:ras guanine nucleotide exchange factor P-like [Gigantopelta aegis]
MYSKTLLPSCVWLLACFGLFGRTAIMHRRRSDNAIYDNTNYEDSNDDTNYYNNNHNTNYDDANHNTNYDNTNHNTNYDDANHNNPTTTTPTMTTRTMTMPTTTMPTTIIPTTTMPTTIIPTTTTTDQCDLCCEHSGVLDSDECECTCRPNFYGVTCEKNCFREAVSAARERITYLCESTAYTASCATSCNACRERRCRNSDQSFCGEFLRRNIILAVVGFCNDRDGDDCQRLCRRVYLRHTLFSQSS